MQDGTIAKRYASALAELADEGGTLEKVGSDLDRFIELINVTPGLASLLNSPTTSQAAQHKVVDAFMGGGGEEITGNFLRVLVEKRRLGAINGIVTSYKLSVEERSGQVTVYVTSATPLNKKHEESLISSLSGMTGKKVQLDVSTDFALLGGVVLRVGSVMMDYSLRGQLNRLKSQMRG
ncbi:MAG: ATP synthase F1 subunit delta [Magnetococcales bacterium]|nr:ATP synthase F1 subunit delta [Magnetococcales bacterium]